MFLLLAFTKSEQGIFCGNGVIKCICSRERQANCSHRGLTEKPKFSKRQMTELVLIDLRGNPLLSCDDSIYNNENPNIIILSDCPLPNTERETTLGVMTEVEVIADMNQVVNGFTELNKTTPAMPVMDGEKIEDLWNMAISAIVASVMAVLVALSLLGLWIKVKAIIKSLKIPNHLLRYI